MALEENARRRPMIFDIATGGGQLDMDGKPKLAFESGNSAVDCDAVEPATEVIGRIYSPKEAYLFGPVVW